MKTLFFGLALSFAISAHAHYEVVGGDVVRDQFGLVNLDLDVRKDDVVEQTHTLKNRIFFKTAIRESLKSFLTDASHPESPLALCFEEAFAKLGVKPSYPVPSNVVSTAQEILLGYLNRNTTQLRMLSLRQHPEGGESVQNAWILELRVRDLSDHIQWAVVDRLGHKKTYNYGFN